MDFKVFDTKSEQHIRVGVFLSSRLVFWVFES